MYIVGGDVLGRYIMGEGYVFVEETTEIAKDKVQTKVKTEFQRNIFDKHVFRFAR